MGLGGHGGGPLGLTDVLLVRDGDEGERQAGGDASAGAALGAEGLRDVAAVRVPQGRRHGRLQVRPAGQHLVGAARAPFTGPVAVRDGRRPIVLQGVDHLPGGLHLVVVGEERPVAEEDVEQQAFEARAGLGGRTPRTRSPSRPPAPPWPTPAPSSRSAG